MSLAQNYACATVDYLERDLISFESVFHDRTLPGKLGIAMITNATAALDLFAWMLYQEPHSTKPGKEKFGNGELFTKLAQDPRFFSASAFGNPKFLYAVVRCGVVHQFYTKGLDIVAWDSDAAVLQSKSGKPLLNALGFLRTTLEGLRKARDYFLMTATSAELAKCDARMALRIQQDDQVLQAAKLNVASLPLLA